MELEMPCDITHIDKLESGLVVEVILLLLDVPHDVLHGADVRI